MRVLKQSANTTLLLGPFLDETDGKTAETALTIAQANVLLWKQFGTTLAQKSETTTCTHRSNGLYTCPINTTDTDTLGILTVSVHVSGALPIRQDYTVLPANIYDAWVAGSAFQAVDANKVVWSITGTTLTVKETDGTTTAYTRTLTATPGADPITAVA